jgi:integrase
MKTQSNTTKIIIRKDAVKKDGTAALALRVRIGGQVKFLPLGVSVKVDEFDERKEKVVVGGQKKITEQVNTIIDLAKTKAKQIMLDSVIKSQALTMNKFLKEFSGYENKASFIEYFRKWIKLYDGIKAPATLKSYYTTLKKLQEFKEDIRFCDLSPEFIAEFDRHMIKKKYETNYITRIHKLTQAAINSAIESKLIEESENPYKGFRFKHAKTERSFLNMDELQKLIDLYNAKRLRTDEQEVLRYFLFSAVAGGIRLGDVKAITWDDVIDDLLVFRPEKTTKNRMVLKIPLSNLAKSIINDVPKKQGKLFASKADAVTNRLLKSIQKEAGLNQLLTFHVSRHTFATVYLAIGGKVHVLQKIMGHGKIETTMVYVHILHEQKIEDMAKFDQIFGKIGQIDIEPRK